MHDSVKFELKKYVKLPNQDFFEKEWKNENISVLLKMKRNNSTWNDITQKAYGKKSLRFTHLSDGSVGIWIVQRIPFEELINTEDASYNFKKSVVYENFEYELIINVSAEIKNELMNRKNNKQKVIKHKKRKNKMIKKYSIYVIIQNPIKVEVFRENNFK